MNSLFPSRLKIQYEITGKKKKITNFSRIQNETEDERINEKFSRVFEGNMRFSFCASNKDNEIEEDDER